MFSPLKIIECPRDAMQGWPVLIETQRKIDYLNILLQVGFDTLDCVSFVSPKAIPQMADSAEVLAQLDTSQSNTKLLAIVANARGAQTAADFDSITYLGYPFSVSPTFQKLNTNSTMEESWERVLAIQEICQKQGKELVVYLSMGFGNPYGDAYDEAVIGSWIEEMQGIGIKIVSLADTVGLATTEQVKRITSAAIQAFPKMEIGVHLHSTPQGLAEKLEAAYSAGCKRFDGALKGIGGCPMANNALVGNMDTEKLIGYFNRKNLPLSINIDALKQASDFAAHIFNQH
jgi:hydroxymethylglutaryl-CoA lyase